MISTCSRVVEKKGGTSGGPDCPDVKALTAILATHWTRSVSRYPDNVAPNSGPVFYENPDR